MKPSISAIALLALALALSACKPGASDATADTPASAPNAQAGASDQPGQDIPPATAPQAANSTPTAVPDSGDTPSSSGLERMDGYGDMRFGMTTDQAKHAWGGELNGKPDDPQGCYVLTPKWVKSPLEFAFVIEGGKFVRYDTRQKKDTAPGGGKVGMSAQEIRSLYGSAMQASPHKYVQGGEFLSVKDAAGGEGKLVFETGADGKVTAWHVGVPPQVDYVERCD